MTSWFALMIYTGGICHYWLRGRYFAAFAWPMDLGARLGSLAFLHVDNAGEVKDQAPPSPLPMREHQDLGAE